MSQARSRRRADRPHVQSKQGRTRIPYEVEPPEFWDPSRSSRPFLGYYRDVFLDAVNRREPEVLQSLRALVWEKLKPETNNEQLLAQWTEQHLKKRFHLTDDWIGVYVRHTLNLWTTSPGWFQDVGWPAVRLWGSMTLPETLTRFPLPTLRWEVLDEPWSKFEVRATAAFHQSLTDYRRRMTGLAVSHGYRKSPRKRARDGRHPLIAFDFLAMWQVCGLTAEEVATEFDTALDRRFLKKEAIMDQIRWAAKSIELTLRKPTGQGRRPLDRQ